MFQNVDFQKNKQNKSKIEKMRGESKQENREAQYISENGM